MRKPFFSPVLKKTIYFFILLAALLTLIYFFADITEIQYYIEDMFFPAEEIPVEQPNFIDF